MVIVKVLCEISEWESSRWLDGVAKSQDFSHNAWVQIPVLPLISYVDLELFNLGFLFYKIQLVKVLNVRIIENS